MKKNLSKKKIAIKNAVVFSLFAAASIGIGAAGFLFAGGLIATAVSALSVGLGAVWAGVGCKSIANAVKATKEEKTQPGLVAKAQADHEAFQELDKKSQKFAYQSGKKLRKIASAAAEKQYQDNVQNAKDDLDFAKEEYKFSDKTSADKAQYIQSQKKYSADLIDARNTKDTQIASIPKKPTKYKLARGLAITGAVVGSAISILGGLKFFDQFNKAETLANEAGTTKQEFIDNQETTNNSIITAASGVALASTIAAAVVAGAAKKRQKENVSMFDYDQIISPAKPISTNANDKAENFDTQSEGFIKNYQYTYIIPNQQAGTLAESSKTDSKSTENENE